MQDFGASIQRSSDERYRPKRIRRLPIGVNLSGVAAGGARPRHSSEGRCTPCFQIYRMSAQTDRLLVWRLLRRDVPGLNARSNAGVENVSTSFHAPREPQQSTRLGLPDHKFFSQPENGTYLMRLPSVMCGARAPIAANADKVDARWRLPEGNRMGCVTSDRICWLDQMALQ
jgi:hypothetical protein